MLLNIAAMVSRKKKRIVIGIAGSKADVERAMIARQAGYAASLSALDADIRLIFLPSQVPMHALLIIEADGATGGRHPIEESIKLGQGFEADSATVRSALERLIVRVALDQVVPA
jgi:hypothetical protein